MHLEGERLEQKGRENPCTDRQRINTEKGRKKHISCSNLLLGQNPCTVRQRINTEKGRKNTEKRQENWQEA
jgi:hypothetical protein